MPLTEDQSHACLLVTELQLIAAAVDLLRSLDFESAVQEAMLEIIADSVHRARDHAEFLKGYLEESSRTYTKPVPEQYEVFVDNCYKCGKPVLQSQIRAGTAETNLKGLTAHKGCLQ